MASVFTKFNLSVILNTVIEQITEGQEYVKDVGCFLLKSHYFLFYVYCFSLMCLV